MPFSRLSLPAICLVSLAVLASGCEEKRRQPVGGGGGPSGNVTDAGATDGAAPQAGCGNGRLDPGERCDRMIAANAPGACLASCSDGNACTRDVTSGAAASCDVSCAHEPITACMGGDGCCAQGCTPATDSDCSATCGNGSVDMGETCDRICPVGCDDGNACTRDSMLGAPATCNVTCVRDPIRMCQTGDYCCPPGCTAADDRDCSSTCGNNVVEPGETCDGNCPRTCDDMNACTLDVITGSPQACNVACTRVAISQCAAGDGCCPAGCSAANDADCSSSCGNGRVDQGEACDGNCPSNCADTDRCTIDFVVGSAATCSAQCAHQTITQCRTGDGCCPAGCNYASDTECPMGPGSDGGVSPDSGGSTFPDAGPRPDGSSSGTFQVGDPCTYAGGGCGEGLFCLDPTEFPQYPGGYCSWTCSGPESCPSFSVCVMGYCPKFCTVQEECRPEYSCHDADGDNSKECVPPAP